MTGGEVHLWLVELDAEREPPAEPLSTAERERAERLRDPAAGRRWATSRWALREVLGRYLGQAPGAVALALGEHGKPELAGERPGLEFNLSHSGDLALVAVAGAAVGVDVERIDPDRDFLSLAKRALDGEAVEAIASSPEELRAAAFYAAWTAHEARLKCGGGGFGGPAPAPELTAVTVAVGGGYAAAYAVAGERPRERRYRLDLR
ncbi:MAG TPA: 4'-phosphopantetheinyl transferase superfamily protein [Solirubrobacterales bacterium]|nr:4'-phosphopantetheinyl transferase superfamily protein [Solirubrobacterales bacterium]